MPADVRQGATWAEDLPNDETLYSVRLLSHTVTCPCVCCCCGTVTPPPAGAKQVEGNAFACESSLALWKPMYCVKCAHHASLASQANKPFPAKMSGSFGCGCFPCIWIVLAGTFTGITQSEVTGGIGATLLTAVIWFSTWHEENKARDRIEAENAGARHAARAAMTPECTAPNNAGLLVEDEAGLYLGFYNPRIAELYAKLNSTRTTF